MQVVAGPPKRKSGNKMPASYHSAPNASKMARAFGYRCSTQRNALARAALDVAQQKHDHRHCTINLQEMD